MATAKAPTEGNMDLETIERLDARRGPPSARRGLGSQWLGIGVIALALIGCGGADGSTAAVSDLDLDGAIGEGLPGLADVATSADWWLAPPGCEGVLDVTMSFAVASAEHGLVAAVDPTGEIVCVDTIEAMRAELVEQDRTIDAATLVQRFSASAWFASPLVLDGGRVSGDPHPEPNDCWNCGDPHPEPNTDDTPTTRSSMME